MAELPEAIGVFKPETARRVLAATQAWERSPTPVGMDESPTSRLPIVFRNNSGHEIPPYGIMQSNGMYAGTVSHIDVVRPISTSAVLSVPLVNGPVAVPNGKFGTAQNGPVYRVKHDASVTFNHGDRIGWKASSFLATLGCLMVVIADDDVVPDCVKAMFDHTELLGTSATTITASTEGDVTVSSISGSKTYKAKTIGGTIASGVPVVLFPVRGEWKALEICS